MKMELLIAGLEADGFWIIQVYEASVLAETRSGARYRFFLD